MLIKRINARREVRTVFNFLSRRANHNAALLAPPGKDVDAHSQSTQDMQDAISEQEAQLPPPDETQTRKDREAVKAENAKVYDRDLDLEDGVRLLRIQPGTGPLSASLEYHDLKEPPEYDALSYCWGAQQDLDSITIDAIDGFRISKHLYAAMRRLRRPDRERLVWIDVICVNQANIPERNRSVQLMWKIYAEARRVIVWVGETEAEKTTCKRLFAANAHEDSQLVWCTQKGLPALEHDHVTRKLEDVLQQLEWQSNTNGGDVWWRRLWVIQEFTRAKEHPTVYIGPHAISWPFFARLMKTDTHDRLPLFHHLRSQDEQSLLQLLFMAKDFYCSDPRDRVYALLGLVKGGVTTIVPDYSEPVPRVYEDATLYLMQSERNVDVVLDERLERNGGGYPTWVPHFALLRHREVLQGKDDYKAGPGDPDVRLVELQDCEQCSSATGRALQLRAIPFGTIKACASERKLPAPDSTHRRIMTRHGQEEKPELERPLQTVDQVFAALQVNFSQEPALPLDRATGLGYLMLDYLFGGDRSAVDEYNRTNHTRLDEERKRKVAREVEKLAQKYGIHLTEARKLDLTLTALWENAFLTVRHKGIYTPDDDARRLLSDEQEMYHVPAKLRKRDFFTTEDGFVGMGPSTLQAGDEVIVPFGASRPFIGRKHGDHHVLIGDAVVPGIMSGQLVNLYKEGSIKAKYYLLK